jgi:hypothetical protein
MGKRQEAAADHRGHGTDVHAVMAWLFGVVFLGNPVTPPPIPESGDPDNYNGGSPNMKGLYSLAWWVYEALAGRGGVGRKRFLNWLAYEARCHGHGEAFSASHGQLWAGIFGAALLIAIRNGDAEIRDYARRWWAFELAVYLCCEVPRIGIEKQQEPSIRTEPWLPGGRSVFKGRETLGSYATRGKLLQAVRGQRIAGKPNQYDLGVHCLAKLSTEERAGLLRAPTELPATWTPFHARRFSDESTLAYFDGPPGMDSVQMAGYIDGEKWVSIPIDQALIDRYAAKGQPALSIDTEQSEVPGIEARRGNLERRHKA